MNAGDAIPDVSVATAEGHLQLPDLAGSPAVIYFYPKDDTPGCTREAQDFTALASDFAGSDITVLGVSRDTLDKHAAFTRKHGLAVRLGSDENGSVCDAFGTWGEKQLYGKTYMGIERATFLFDAEGRLVRAWRKVKVPGHAQAVLDAARAL